MIEAAKIQVSGQRHRVTATLYCSGINGLGEEASHEDLYSAVRMLEYTGRRSGNTVSWLAERASS